MKTLKNLRYFATWVVLNQLSVLFAAIYLLGGLRGHPWNVLLGEDNKWNAILDGHPDEKISARVWRQKQKGKRRGRIAVRLIDGLLGRGHCHATYQKQRAGGFLPEDYQQGD